MKKRLHSTAQTGQDTSETTIKQTVEVVAKKAFLIEKRRVVCGAHND